MTEAAPTGEPGHDGHPAVARVERATRALALLGGLLLLAASVMVTASVVMRAFGTGGISGDFEMMEIANALAVFAFLPFCQARRGNIMVDTFTGWLPAGARRLLDGLWDLAWAALAALIAWQSFIGGREESSYGTTSMAAGIPIGPAIVATAVLAAVLALVAAITGLRMIAGRA